MAGELLNLIRIQRYGLVGGPARRDQEKEGVARAMLDAYLPLTNNFSRGDMLAQALESPLGPERRSGNNLRGSVHGRSSQFGQHG